ERWPRPNLTDSSNWLTNATPPFFLNRCQRKIKAGTEPGVTVRPPVQDGRSYSHNGRGKNSSINPVIVRSVIDVRQGIDASGDKSWLDVSARDALGFAVMARVRTEKPVLSPAAPLTSPPAREVNPGARSDAAAISAMMPEVYEDLRRLAETFLRG